MEIQKTSMNNLSEGCISCMLSFTSPRDVCRCASVSTIFRSAADSDEVWNRFLPSSSDISHHYSDISISTSDFPSKKDLYFALCCPTPFNNGTMGFWLERSSGKKCLMLSARALNIAWGSDMRYWQWVTPSRPSVFKEMARLDHVWWFHVIGTFDSASLSPNTTYSVHFIIDFVEYHHGFESPVTLSLHVTSHPLPQTRTAIICPVMGNECDDEFIRPSVEFEGWRELEIGRFFCDGSGEQVEASMREVHRYKQGITILGLVIRPVL